MKSIILPGAKIGWIGTGTMGSLMAGNLARAGYRVRVWNRTMPNDGIAYAASQGCTVVSTVEDALIGSQVVCTCVTDGRALNDVLLALNRDLKALLPQGAVVVDFSTIGPVEAKQISKRLNEIEVQFVDAPITGGDAGARDRTLTFMVGADDDLLERLHPLLAAMGKRIVHAGPVGSGQSLKLVNQLLCAANLLAVVEAFHVAEMLGVDRSLVVDACGSGAAGSWQLVNLGSKIITQDNPPGFKAKHMLKDLCLLKDALAGNPADFDPPFFALAVTAFERLLQIGGGEMGTQAVSMSHATGGLEQPR